MRRNSIPLPSLFELGFLAMVGYSVYAYGYKQQSWQETQTDLMTVPLMYTEAISKAPDVLFSTLSKIKPYQEWSQGWIQNKLDTNGNRPY